MWWGFFFFYQIKINSIAMSVVGLSAQERQNILQLVAAILHLGNVSFVEDRSNFANVQDERCKPINS